MERQGWGGNRGVPPSAPIPLSSRFTTGLRGFLLGLVQQLYSNASLSLLQSIIHLAHRILMHRWKHMTVDVHGHTHLIMAQQFLNYFRMHTHAQKHRRSTMPQIMKTHLW